MNPLALSAPRLATLTWVIVGVVYLVALALPTAWLPSDDLGLRRFRTPEITTGMPLAQTFEMTADGLQAIEFYATPTRERVSGDIRLELWDVTGGPDRLVRSAEVEAADLVSAFSYRFEFPPVLDSNNRIYRLDLITSGASPAQGVALLATKGERYAGGTLLVNGMIRWADLAFETYAPAPSGLALLLATGRSVPSRGHFVLAAFAANWIALGVLLHAFSRMSDDTRQGTL